MRRFLIGPVALLLITAALGSPRSSGVSAASRWGSPPLKKTCHTVTKKVHGKKKRVKVCNRVARPTATPTITPTPDVRRLDAPFGVAVDTQGYLYLTVLDPSRVMKLAPDGSYVTSFGADVLQQKPTNAANPDDIECAALADYFDRSTATLYVGDGCVHQVFAFSTTGQLLGQYPKDPAVSATWSDGDPQYPVADAQGNVYLTEIYPGNLDKFSPDGSQKSVIWTYGAPGPLGLALDPTGDIYVGLARDDIVVEISPAGKEIARSGFADNGQGQTTVRGLAIDSHGNIYASVDGGGGCNPGDQITEFSPDLKSQHAVATAGTGPGQVCAPQGLAVDTQDNLYVPDLFNNRVQKFSPSGKLLATFTGD